MIDLTEELPHSIEHDGKVYELDTSFRTWIRFDRDLRMMGVASNYVFSCDIPDDAGALDALYEFFEPKEATPTSSESGDRIIDYTLDGSYLVASFMQEYGIDLTAQDMHWHVFLALVNGLSDETIMGRAMSYRGYRPTKKTHDALMSEAKRKWALPDIGDMEEKIALLEWADELGF